MLSEQMRAALNDQINMELEAAYVYAAMANHFEHQALKGFAHWMRLQSSEELDHARKFIDYMSDRGAPVEFKTIAAPQGGWSAPLAVFEDALAHERKVTASINRLSSMAIKEADHATHALLEWFVSEQVEEEANADEIVQQLKLADGAPGALFIMDREMAQRQPDGSGGN